MMATAESVSPPVKFTQAGLDAGAGGADELPAGGRVAEGAGAAPGAGGHARRSRSRPARCRRHGWGVVARWWQSSAPNRVVCQLARAGRGGREVDDGHLAAGLAGDLEEVAGDDEAGAVGAHVEGVDPAGAP